MMSSIVFLILTDISLNNKKIGPRQIFLAKCMNCQFVMFCIHLYFVRMGEKTILRGQNVTRTLGAEIYKDSKIPTDFEGKQEKKNYIKKMILFLILNNFIHNSFKIKDEIFYYLFFFLLKYILDLN